MPKTPKTPKMPKIAMFMLAPLLGLICAPLTLADEQIMMPHVAGWKRAFALQTPHMRIATYAVPYATDKYEWVTLEWFSPQLVGPVDALKMAALASTNVREHCADGKDMSVYAGYENGYPTAVRLFTCPASKERPTNELLMFKAVQGKTGTWIVLQRRQVSAAGAWPIPGLRQPMMQMSCGWVASN